MCISLLPAALINDCSSYLDGATEFLLQYLILNEKTPCLDSLIKQLAPPDNYKAGPRQNTIRADILRLEGALSAKGKASDRDLALRSWMK